MKPMPIESLRTKLGQQIRDFGSKMMKEAFWILLTHKPQNQPHNALESFMSPNQAKYTQNALKGLIGASRCLS
jgi:hypothetical protein